MNDCSNVYIWVFGRLTEVLRASHSFNHNSKETKYTRGYTHRYNPSIFIKYAQLTFWIVLASR